MKIKKRLILTFACAATVAFGAFGAKFAKTSVSAADWQEITLAETYSYGATVTVPERTVTANGTSKTATAYVTFPDGSVTSATTITADVFGIYTVNYYAEINGKHYSESETFEVERKAYAVGTENSSVEYGHYDKYGADSDGLIVRLANKDTLTFSNLIDVSDITKSDYLIRAFITPDQQGTPDFSRFVVTLTDSEDDSVYLRLHVNRYISDQSGFGVCFAMAGGNGQDMVGYEKNKGLHVNDGVGSVMENTSFRAQRQTAWSGAAYNVAPDTVSFTLSYDAATNQAYAQDVLIADMDDPTYYRQTWNGFPSGKVRMSISGALYNASSANFCILYVAGTDTETLRSNNFVDSKGPNIKVDTEYDEMPVAQIGTEYSVPAATARDEYTGVAKVTTTVFYGYGEENPVTIGVKDGKFKPSKPGYYTIEYKATDGFGNVSVVTKSVRALKNVPEISAEVPTDAAKTAVLGVATEVKEPVTSGGSGNLAVVKTVTFGKTVTEIDDSFVPQVAGKYTVTYTVTDYLGQVAACSYEVTAAYSGAPVFSNEATLPMAFISGSGYTLPELYADDYAGGKHKTVLADVKVKDANGEKIYKAGSRFIPEVRNDGDEVEVTYYSGKTAFETVKIPAIIARENGKVYGYKYFVGDTEMSYNDENGEKYRRGGVASVVKADSDRAGWFFANPLIAEGLEVQFSTVNGLTNFSAFEFILTDSADYSKSVKVTLGVNSKKVNHGVKEYSADFNLAKGNIFTLGYEAGSVSLTTEDVSVFVSLSQYENGEKFTGFPSGRIYLSVNTLGNKANARYKIENVNGNVVSYANRDNEAPALLLYGNYGGSVKKGRTFVTNIAEGSDVYAPETEVSFTVYDPDGKVVSDVKGKKMQNVIPDKVYEIKAGKYGQYKVVYLIKTVGWMEEEQEHEFEITYDVPDDLPPTIKFTNNGTKTAKVGDVIVMPDFTVSDNLTPSGRILVWKYVINPYGQLVELEGDANSVIARIKGEYTFVVYAQDVILRESADADTPNNAAVLKWVNTER